MRKLVNEEEGEVGKAEDQGREVKGEGEYRREGRGGRTRVKGGLTEAVQRERVGEERERWRTLWRGRGREHSMEDRKGERKRE